MVTLDKVVCINLKDRTDRRESMTKELKKAGLLEAVEWLPGVSHMHGKVGFSQAQYNALFACRDANHALVLEDDCVFTGHIALDTVLSELPQSYDALWLGGNVRTQNNSKATAHLWHCQNTWTTHAVLYSKKMIKWILENYKPPKYRIEYDIEIYDEWLRVEAQNKRECYICKPFIAVQKEDYSDIEKRPTYYGALFHLSQGRLR